MAATNSIFFNNAKKKAMTLFWWYKDEKSIKLKIKVEWNISSGKKFYRIFLQIPDLENVITVSKTMFNLTKCDTVNPCFITFGKDCIILGN